MRARRGQEATVSSRTVKLWRGEPMEMLARKAVRPMPITTGTWSTPCLYIMYICIYIYMYI